MKLVTVPLSKTRLAPLDHRLRELDDARVSEIAASHKSGGSAQIHDFIAYLSNGLYNVCGECHAWAGFRDSHSDDADVRVLDLDVKTEKDLLIWLLRADNHRSLGPDLWRAHLLRLRPDFPTQHALAETIGISEGYVSEILNGDPKARRKAEKEARQTAQESREAAKREAREESLRAKTTESYILPPPQRRNEAMTPVPSIQGEPRNLPAIPMPEPLRAAPPPEKAVREHAEALQAALRSSEWKDASASAKRVAHSALAALDGTVYDWRFAIEFGAWTENGPKPQSQTFKFSVSDEVRLATEDNGHRAWILAHLPGGKVKLRILRGKEKSEEIHLERDILIAARSEKA